MSGPAGLRTALAFLTRLPVRATPWTADGLARAAVWFPLVGLVVGGLAAGVRALAGLALEPAPATVLALAAAVLVTGALHEDGLADTADGLGAHVGRERRLEIMRDSRIGTYGALGIVLPLGLAYATLSSLDTEDFARAAVCGHVLGRWSTLPQAFFLAGAREGGAGASLSVSLPALIVGTLLAIPVAIGFGGLVPGLVALGAAVGLGLGCGAALHRILGGVTGDTFGAVNKLTEVATYVALVAVWGA